MVSRIANSPVEIPAGVEVTLQDGAVSVKGKLGQLCESLHKTVKVEKADNIINVIAINDSIEANALAGTTRALLNNMVHGVSEGFQKKLVMIGVGYRAKAQGKSLDLSVGFSHPVKMAMPEGITAETPAATEIVIKGSNKQQVAQVAANIRAIRPPEPYKGKGIRYENEHVVRKETKKK